ncbi:hypothetical protein OH76DRAFT_525312 [Lentinus brumalis]|uniref:Uncharacterized protein n=1 Tax=Lentinus brumalis TaxID=2498619 RepID=A0A371CHQ5_9APHY|nr:hypothetical protein OH76DRAFT_525312 [Polyporus brumalis]
MLPTHTQILDLLTLQSCRRVQTQHLDMSAPPRAYARWFRVDRTRSKIASKARFHCPSKTRPSTLALLLCPRYGRFSQPTYELVAESHKPRTTSPAPRNGETTPLAVPDFAAAAPRNTPYLAQFASDRGHSDSPRTHCIPGGPTSIHGSPWRGLKIGPKTRFHCTSRRRPLRHALPGELPVRPPRNKLRYVTAATKLIYDAVSRRPDALEDRHSSPMPGRHAHTRPTISRPPLRRTGSNHGARDALNTPDRLHHAACRTSEVSNRSEDAISLHFCPPRTSSRSLGHRADACRVSLPVRVADGGQRRRMVSQA